MIEIPGRRSVHRTSPPEPAGRPTRVRGLAAAFVIALVPAFAFAVVAPPPTPATTTPPPAVAPAAPAPATTPPTPPPAGTAAPAAPRARAKNEPLVPISTPPPEFPERARRMRLSGYVVVTYTIGTDGLVGNVRIVESEPRGVFEHEVESALARWRYEPLAAPREITHTFDFEQ